MFFVGGLLRGPRGAERQRKRCEEGQPQRLALCSSAAWVLSSFGCLADSVTPGKLLNLSVLQGSHLQSEGKVVPSPGVLRTSGMMCRGYMCHYDYCCCYPWTLQLDLSFTGLETLSTGCLTLPGGAWDLPEEGPSLFTTSAVPQKMG